MFDAHRVRRDFPILGQQVHGRPLVYLDSAASSQKPTRVVDAMRRYYEEAHSNVHRGVHTLASRATDAYEGARTRVAEFIGAPSRDQVIWTRGTTEAINLVAYSWARRRLKAGDEILLSLMEHHSNLIPWQLAAQDTGARLRFLPLQADGTLDLSRLDELLNDRTRMVAVTHMSNVLGTINPVRELADAAHARGALLLVDAAQSVPHMPVDVASLDCDFLVFSGHKMLGPTGIGALYGRREVLESMHPFLGGGEMILEVGLESSTFKPLPYRFEAGTPAIAETVGLAAAIDYLEELGMDQVRAHERELTAYAIGVLEGIGGVTVHGPRGDRGGAISFSVDGIHPHDLATILDHQGVAIRAGHHCCQPLMKWLGEPATARASFYVYNGQEDADALAAAIDKAKGIFSRTGQTV